MSPDNQNRLEQHSPPPPDGRPTKSALPGPHRLNHTDTDPDLVARLEWLDDLMFAAIDGDPVSLETVIDAWKKMVAELGSHVLEESRQQYLRRAQSVWHELRSEPNHPPHKIFAAIEVISLLAGKAW
ncbi:MAG: hypothetical protein WD738_11450 [Pirellulales bacterium]